MFTGDRSGDFLYAALWRARLANQPTSHDRGDGLRLDGVWISAAVRCAPPANRPSPAERDRCLPFAARELELLADVRVILCLGAFAWEAALALVAPEIRPRPRFAHGAELEPGSGRPLLCASYHVSQQNTFTGRLTPQMLDDVLARAANAAAAAGR
jgi:uracil-DNA glycosylase